VTIRDDVREKQATLAARADVLGKNIGDVRRETCGTGGFAAQITRAINEPTPTAGHERLGWDDFAGQTFDGTNQDFTLSQRVLGQNIMGWHIIQATGTAQPLTKTTNPAPSAGQFYFDDRFTVRVGTPPSALDGLIFAYVTSP
jgi:hypothetical protein